MNRIGLAVLGSTGSIGRQTLDVVRLHRRRFEVVALAASGRKLSLLRDQIKEFSPKIVVVGSKGRAQGLQVPGTRVLVGEEGLIEAATSPAVAVVAAAVVGTISLRAVYMALQAGKRVALANKETLVAAGELIMGLVTKGKGLLLPIDSEHSALFQCLMGQRREDIARLWLTASGGPFLNLTREELGHVTKRDTLAHPVWNMGEKVTVDSATLMNKGLEVIEARWLFGADPSMIKVLIHSQGLIHSVVEFKDGAMLAQMGPPDMRIPISFALGYPERLGNGVKPLDLLDCPALTFGEPDTERFPLLALAYKALEMGGTAPAALNAANEVAVETFLREEISFLQIPQVVSEVLTKWEAGPANSLDAILHADKEARKRALEVLGRIKGRSPFLLLS